MVNSKRNGSTIKSRTVDATPGVKISAMKLSYVDTSGREWPAGTEFRPSRAGHDGVRGRDYQEVVIDGDRVRFEWA